MVYDYAWSINWGKKIKKWWKNWQNERLLREYYRNQSHTGSRVSWLLQDLFIFFVLSLIIIWEASTVWTALWRVTALGVLLVLWRKAKQKKEYACLKKSCYQKTAEREFMKRLGKTSPQIIIKLLGEQITRNFPVGSLYLNKKILEGVYNGKKLAVAYLEVNGGEEVSTQELFVVIKRCFHEGIFQLRVFTNGEFNENTVDLQQYYELDLRLYNKEKLMYLLKSTPLFPSISEIKTIIDQDKAKKRKKLQILKKGMLEKNKLTRYLTYSVLLLFMAWYRIGIVYLNIIAGLVLLGFAVVTIIKTISITLKSPENESYFKREGF